MTLTSGTYRATISKKDRGAPKKSMRSKRLPKPPRKGDGAEADAYGRAFGWQYREDLSCCRRNAEGYQINKHFVVSGQSPWRLPFICAKEKER